MESVKTFKQLRKFATDQGGVVSLHMADLREINGAERLGTGVRDEISRELERNNLGYVGKDGQGKDLPRYSEDPVRIYVRGSAVGQFIEALADVGEGGDERLRELTGQAANKLDRIRTILDE